MEQAMTKKTYAEVKAALDALFVGGEELTDETREAFIAKCEAVLAEAGWNRDSFLYRQQEELG